MFNPENGRKLLDQLHDAICKEEDVELWYEDDYYDTERCWERAASDLNGRKGLLGKKGRADLVAYLMGNADDSDASDVFADGFWYAVAEELDRIHRTRPKRWMQVTIDGCELGVTAWVDTEDTWNGFLKPYFPDSAHVNINELLEEVGAEDKLTFDPDKDEFICGEETFHGVEVDGMWLYPIGAGSWIWTEAE